MPNITVVAILKVGKTLADFQALYRAVDYDTLYILASSSPVSFLNFFRTLNLRFFSPSD